MRAGEASVRIGLFGSGLALMLMAGCPSTPSDCRAAGTCEPGTPCTTGSECRNLVCGPLVAGAASECLRPCTSMADCAAGQTCELLAGAGAFCQGAIVGADAGPTPTDDAGPPGDAGPDTDGDGDGIPSSTDCDDTNAAIGTMNVESCMGACGFGTVVCTNGVRTACSAATDCSCPTPGEVRTIPCGRCGIASQSCGADSRWSVPSACTDEHECITGAVEARTPRCGREERVCDSTCMWRSWSEVVPPRECEPGEEDTLMNEFCGIAAVDVRTCQDDCLYGPSEGCRPLCRRGPRTSRIGAATTCIPEGEFILGTTTYADAMPVRTIAISDFWVAVDPATAGEYRRCVTEGGCTAVVAPSFAALTDRQAAVGVTQMQAAMFCAWDGGELITEFQWEKAARGPAPSRQEHPWGDVTPVPCTQVPGPGCFFWPPEVDALPESYSPFGVHLMATIYEWTSTHYREGWAWIPDGTVDPPSPPAATYPEWTDRGYRTPSDGSVRVPSTTSGRGSLVGSEDFLSIRCTY